MEEILHQLIGSFSDYLQDFIHPTGGCLGFLPPTVVIFNESVYPRKVFATEKLLYRKRIGKEASSSPTVFRLEA